jgi:phage terminase large subunit
VVSGGWRKVYVLDCYSMPFGTLEPHADEVHRRNREHGWKSGADWVPHDAKVIEWGSGRTRVEQMEAARAKADAGS